VTRNFVDRGQTFLEVLLSPDDDKGDEVEA